ncbi:MAG: hypothetical protein QGG36_10360 [Pirellulaceae bacterium]|nr:hypothetical protein [Pirellulaceae bacterium]
MEPRPGIVRPPRRPGNPGNREPGSRDPPEGTFVRGDVGPPGVVGVVAGAGLGGGLCSTTPASVKSDSPDDGFGFPLDRGLSRSGQCAVGISAAGCAGI